MKVCPVCNEFFADDLRFCDLDGTKLKREPGSQPPSSQGRVWSLLGVGVLLGALAIATLSIIFTPRPDVAPTIASSTPAPSTAQGPPANTLAAATDAQSTPATAQPDIVVEETAPPAPKKKDKALDSLNSNASLPDVNPKEASQPKEEASKDGQGIEASKADSSIEPKKIETAPAVKPTNDTRESPNSPKAAATTEAKKDKKATNAKDADKDSDSKKKDDDKEKKKGGFFRVFKKIFGKS